MNRDGVAPGTRLGPYEIVAPIGAGGMGEVYRARDARLARDVAIKILPAALTDRTDRLRRFEEEARAAGQLNHPNIMTVYDAGTHDGLPYIVSELLEGATLRDRLADGPLSLHQAVDFARQIADGLAAAHDKGIVHRDLKPENLFIVSGGRVKILDFGLAKLTQPGDGGALPDQATETMPGTTVGTVGYMSPEQIRGERVDSRSDLFNAGVVLCEMLTGIRPFARATSADTTAAILRDDPAAALQSVPEAIRPIVRRCLAKDPAARFQSAHDLAFALQATTATPRSSGRAFGWAAAAAVVIVAAALLWSLAPHAPGARAVGATGRPAVAVMPFDSPSGAPEIAWLTRGVPNMLTTALAQTPGLDVIGGARIDAAAQQVGGRSGDPRARVEIARRSGAGAFVTGSVFRVANEVRVDVQVEEVASGRVVVAMSVHGGDVFPLVDQIGERIRSGLHVVDEGTTRRITEVTSPSLAAYQAFAAGAEARHNNRHADALRLLSRAIEIDPSFAMAHYELALSARQTGDNALAAASLQKALAHIDRLPERQRLLLEAERVRSSGDERRAATMVEELLKRFPDEEDGYYQLWTWYRNLNDTPALFRMFERGVKNIPDAAPLRNIYGFALLREGRYDEALKQFDEYIRLAPNEPNTYDSMGDAYVFAGDPEPALVKYAEALTHDPTFLISHRGRALALAQLGRFDEALDDAAKVTDLSARGGLSTAEPRIVTAFLLSRVGRVAAAHTEIAAGLDDARRLSDGYAEAALRTLGAWLALEAGRPVVARSEALRARATAASLGGLRSAQMEAIALHFAGLADLRDQRDVAHGRLAAMPRVTPPDTDVTYWIGALEGEIALSAGDLDAADRAFAAALPANKMPFGDFQAILSIFGNELPSRDGPARIRIARGDRAGAIAEYRSLLTPSRTRRFTCVLEPRYVLALARLLNQTGDAAGARAQYERFLALWHAADTNLPELEEAKRELKR